jgi:DNA-directed RNA polymerase II subunit RPB7
MRDYLIHKLHADVEGSCTGRYFIICVIEYENITLGRIIPGKGDAEFTITYKAVVWRPFKGETVRVFLMGSTLITAGADQTPG